MRARIGGVGAQIEPDVVLGIREHRRVRGSRAVLLGLTVRRLDHPGSCSVGAHRVFGRLPEPNLQLSGQFGGSVEDLGAGP